MSNSSINFGRSCNCCSFLCLSLLLSNEHLKCLKLDYNCDYYVGRLKQLFFFGMIDDDKLQPKGLTPNERINLQSLFCGFPYINFRLPIWVPGVKLYLCYWGVDERFEFHNSSFAQNCQTFIKRGRILKILILKRVYLLVNQKHEKKWRHIRKHSNLQYYATKLL